MRVLILRPEELLDQTLKIFRKNGLEAYGCPFIRLSYVDFEVPEHDVAIVTSQNAARILTEKGIKLKTVIAIGKKTAEMLRAEKILIPSKFDSESVYREFKDFLAGKRVVAFRSNKGSKVLKRLAEICDFRDVEVYRIEKLQGDEQMKEVHKVKSGFYHAVVFSSSMIARSFLELCDDECLMSLKRTLVVAIGPPTSKVLAEFGIKAEVPKEYTFDGIIELLKSKKV